MRLLLEHGAGTTVGKEPFIFDAINAMNVSIIDCLLEKGADCNIQLMIDEDDQDMPLIRNKTRPTHAGDAADVVYPVALAASRKYNTKASRDKMLPVIERLLRGGADPWKMSKKGTSILHDICDRHGILEPFLEMPNLDLEARDSHGRTLFLAACSHSEIWCGSDEDQGFLDDLPTSAALLLSKGADIEARDLRHRNALHWILANRQKMLRRDFVMLMASPSASSLVIQADDSGKTPLFYAFQNQHFWAVDPLLDIGADLYFSDNEGNTVQHLLSQHLASSDQAKRHFTKHLSLGIDVNARNKKGETPLSIYLVHSDEYLTNFSLFTDAGADIMTTNVKGQGLLHVIAGKSRVNASYPYWRRGEKDLEVEIFQWLMAKGLDPTSEDDEQRTPLDLAAAAGNENILRLFERKG
ncbi:hypothetical protein P7C71_g3715, partial [Lecanoromycetidae sp. Uapishka_2]